MIAKIFYSIMPDPRDDEWWYQNIYKKIHYDDDESAIVIPKDKWSKYWKLMGTEVRKEDNVNHFLNYLWALYNDGLDFPNPLSNAGGQAKVKSSGVRHTSMSIGDVIEVDGIFYIAVSVGYRKLELK